MKVYAVISEFNPFHNGHEYLVKSVKEKEDCAVVAIMSGGFVERGDVAIIDKYSRAEAAVLCGVDLVLELPAPWSFSGAEFFALGGVGIAHGLNVVDSLLFGSESGDIVSLLDCDCKLASDEYLEALAKARQTHKQKNASILRAEVYESLYGGTNVLNGSNNLLAIEYLHALRKLSSPISPKTVKRVGGDYNSDELRGVCSATAIRKAISQGIGSFSNFIPEKAEAVLLRELNAGRIYDMKRLDDTVIAMLRASHPSRFSRCMEVSGGIENKLCTEAYVAKSIVRLIEGVKSKRYSESRVRRAILSMLLDVTMSDVEIPPLFTNVLAANDVGRQVLASIRKSADIAVISKMSCSRRLEGLAAKQFELHRRAERLAEFCCMSAPRRMGAAMIKEEI